jgi:lipopolysaccharide transport system ATP-binding protein
VNVVVAGRRYVWRYTAEFHRGASGVNFGMMFKTVDGVDVSGYSSDREFVSFPHVAAGSVMRLAFELRLNVVPGSYAFNAGVGGLVDGRFTYLARRVDVELIRVVPADRRPRYGIAEIEPRFTYEQSSG